MSTATAEAKEKAGVQAINLFEQVRAVDLTSRNDKLEPVGEDEAVLGILDENLRRLYWLRTDLGNKTSRDMELLQELLREHTEAHDRVEETHDCASFKARALELVDDLKKQRETLRLVQDIFWSAVRLQFPAGLDKDIGIRQGYQVIAKPAPDLGNALGGLLAAALMGSGRF